MFKKIISLLLAVMMIMSLVTVMATSTGAVEYENTKLYFDVNGTGWEMGAKDKVGFYIYGDGFEPMAWGAKKTLGTSEGDGIFSFDPAAKKIDLVEGVQYKVIFTKNMGEEQSADLYFDTTCLGHCAYCNGEMIENTVDSTKKSQVALWKDLDPEQYGPVKGITSLGNVVGTCLPQGKTDEDLFTTWLIETGAQSLKNAMKYTVQPGKKTSQQMVDDIGAALGLTKDFVKSAIEDNAQAIADALALDTTLTVTFDWKYDDSTLPSGAHTHTPGEAVQENVVPASCKAEGSYDEVVYCTECGEEISRETKTIDKLAHTPAEAVKENEVPASCKAEGSYDEVVYCSECGEELSRETKTIDKLAHTPAEAVKENEVPATCKAEGSYDEVVYCSECGEELSRETKTIDKLAHTPAEAVKENEVPATCKAEGSYDEVVYCSECGEELSRETKTIDMIAHDIKFVEEVPATASVDGMRAHYECAVCGDLFSDAEGKQPVSAEDLVIKAEHLRGDANGDGVVDITDVTTIQRYLAEYEVPVFDETAADADLDGEVDIIDATLIQRVLLNICNWDKVPANA
jgi:hypothetical protein